MKVICNNLDFCDNKVCQHRFSHDSESDVGIVTHCYYLHKNTICVPISEIRKTKLNKLNENTNL